MIKGCQKRVIVVKHPDTDAFDEAYFIVSEGKYLKKGDTRVLIGEAEKIIRSAGGEKKRRFSKTLLFFSAFLTGALASSLFFWISGAIS